MNFSRPFFYIFYAFLFIAFSFLNACSVLSLLSQDKEKNSLASDPLLAGLFLASLGNCDTGNDLWARNIQTQGSYCVPVDLISIQDKVLLYKERGLNVPIDLEAFAKQFNDQTYPKITNAFGNPSDLDNNGKVIILILDIRDGSTPNGAYVAGFFDPVNQFADGIALPLRSNFGEILYLDGKELVASLSRDPTALASTAAHEFQHLIRYPFMQQSQTLDDTWINEGTSEVASDIAGFGPQSYRLECFSGRDSSRCPNGANGISLLTWLSSSSSTTVLKQYSMAYAYMRYLYDLSGTTESERNAFFRRSVQGTSSGIRANNASQLMALFRETSRYQTSLLGSTNPEAFFRTMVLFFGQSSGTNAYSQVNRIAQDLTTINTIDLSTAYAAYPFESNLSYLVNNPLVTVSGNLSLRTGSAFNIASDVNLADLTNKFENIGLVKNATSSASRSTVIWGAYSSTSPLTSVRGFAKAEEPSPRDKYKSVFENPNPLGHSSPMCGTVFIDEKIHNDESILIEQPSSKSDNTP
ncbi:peptidase MA family protein [Leptospira ryugenii]|uniref:peptidase MA family protein n=1 Tax=Leptospira ryugenii TaxID=1917863 RepID=UPI000D5912DB|nr:peptidase MA family protein [Leptospira ryugenii]